MPLTAMDTRKIPATMPVAKHGPGLQEDPERDREPDREVHDRHEQGVHQQVQERASMTRPQLQCGRRRPSSVLHRPRLRVTTCCKLQDGLKSTGRHASTDMTRHRRRNSSPGGSCYHSSRDWPMLQSLTDVEREAVGTKSIDDGRVSRIALTARPSPRETSLLRVREGGVEPPRPFGHTDLNRARLPIPPLAREARQGYPSAAGIAQTRAAAVACTGVRRAHGAVGRGRGAHRYDRDST